jgi:hypothetical protein
MNYVVYDTRTGHIVTIAKEQPPRIYEGQQILPVPTDVFSETSVWARYRFCNGALERKTGVYLTPDRLEIRADGAAKAVIKVTVTYACPDLNEIVVLVGDTEIEVDVELDALTRRAYGSFSFSTYQPGLYEFRVIEPECVGGAASIYAR